MLFVFVSTNKTVLRTTRFIISNTSRKYTSTKSCALTSIVGRRRGVFSQFAIPNITNRFQCQQSEQEWDYIAPKFAHLQSAIDQHIPYVLDKLEHFVLGSISSGTATPAIAREKEEEEEEGRFTPETVLDVGCGVGTLCRALQKKFPVSAIYGIDISEAMVRFATARNLNLQEKNITIRKAMWPYLPQEMDMRYDLITCSFTLMYLHSPSKGLEEMYKRLNEGGILVIVTWGEAEENPWLAIPQAILSRQKEGLHIPVDINGNGLLDDFKLKKSAPYRLPTELKLRKKLKKLENLKRKLKIHTEKVHMQGGMYFEKGHDQILNFFSFLSNRNKLLLRRVFAELEYDKVFPASFVVGIVQKEKEEGTEEG